MNGSVSAILYYDLLLSLLTSTFVNLTEKAVDNFHPHLNVWCDFPHDNIRERLVHVLV